MLEKDAAAQILNEAGIEAKRLEIETLKDGPLNEIYRLKWESGEAVLWRDSQKDPSFARRSLQLQWVYSELAHLNLPIPHLLYPTEINPERPADHLLMTFLPGEPLEKVLSKVDASQQVEIAEVCGKALANFHKTTAANIDSLRNRATKLGGTAKYGNPFDPPGGPDTWPAHIERQLTHHLGSPGKITPPSFTDRIAGYMEERRTLWAASDHWGRCGLVHNDFTTANILVQHTPENGWQVGGIVDFEWSLIGPPEMDFAKLEAYGYPTLATDRETQAYKEAFLNGYGQVYSFGPNQNELVAVYKLLFYLFWINLEHSWENPAGVKATEQQIENILAQG